MSYPKNKRERFVNGDNKAKRRFYGEITALSTSGESEEEKRKWEAKEIAKRRKTTKLCSCSMCGNPRRKSWKDKLTMQEKKFFEIIAG